MAPGPHGYEGYEMTRVARPPAVARPDVLRPGDPPGVGERLLVLYDVDCGLCLSGRDVLRRWDRGRRLADDLIQRHAHGLLADLSEQDRLATWHVIHPDGRREQTGSALAAVLEHLPGTLPAALITRALPRPTTRAYRWMADHRQGISRTLGTDDHPEKGRMPG